MPTLEQHYAALIHMFLAAPINAIFKPSLTITEGRAETEMDLLPQFLHSGGTMHGAGYFKMLDDAAYFAAASLEQEAMVLTTSFVTYMTRAVSGGRLRAVGQVVNRTRSQVIVEAVLYDGDGREAGRGNGVFTPTKRRLADVPAYRGDPS